MEWDIGLGEMCVIELLYTGVTTVVYRCHILCTGLLICNVGNSVLNRGIYR